MPTLLSRVYVYSLIPFTAFVLVMALTLHIALYMGSHYEPNGLFYGIFFCVNLSVSSLAEDRNIWVNEVQQCPSWLRDTLKVLSFYCIAVSLMCIAGDMHIPMNFFLAASAFMLTFTVGSACVLWVTVESIKKRPADTLRRTQRSFLAIALLSTIYLVFSFFPSKPLHQ